jgi:hypothetical protein
MTMAAVFTGFLNFCGGEEKWDRSLLDEYFALREIARPAAVLQAFREVAGPMLRTRRQAIASLQEKKLEAARKKRKRDA